MTTVSYAQNYEDVMLLRALRGVQRGFYIDVGAQHPVQDSVTRAFYEKGWRGINIEPVAQWFPLVAEDRPEDINLQIAVSDAGKEMDLYEVIDTGLSTISKRYADAHEAEGRTVERHTVPCRSLDDIIDEYVSDEIHFLKIDVEGMEVECLAGAPSTLARARRVVFEYHTPGLLARSGEVLRRAGMREVLRRCPYNSNIGLSFWARSRGEAPHIER